MSGDFFAETFNRSLFTGVLLGLFLMMSGCFAYHKWKHVKSKTQSEFYVAQKTKGRLRKFLSRNSTCSERNQYHLENLAMQQEADNSFEQYDNPGFSKEETSPDNNVFNEINSRNSSDKNTSPIEHCSIHL